SRQAGVPGAQAVEAPGAPPAPAVERVPEEDGQDSEAVDRRGDESRRRRLREVARRYRDLGDPEPRGHDLGDDLLVEDEGVGVRPEVHGLEDLAAKRAVAGVVLREPEAED